MLSKLQDEGRIKIAFDRAGTSNASAEDNQAFQGANALKAIGNDMWKKMVKDTKWFQTYCGGVKKFLSALAQDHSGGMLLVICIHVSSVIPSSRVHEMSHSRLLTVCVLVCCRACLLTGRDDHADRAGGDATLALRGEE